MTEQNHMQRLSMKTKEKRAFPKETLIHMDSSPSSHEKKKPNTCVEFKS